MGDRNNVYFEGERGVLSLLQEKYILTGKNYLYFNYFFHMAYHISPSRIFMIEYLK
jgi:hypothetical protein